MTEWTGTPKDYVTAALASIRWHWGEAYLISAEAGGWDGTWRAKRRDDGKELVALNPHDLTLMIKADYETRPVPRWADVPGSCGVTEPQQP